jgi:cell fate (sporulation/competence/biofilm development) regulator YlbF (YheA/YmcA/DUF963 family)
MKKVEYNFENYGSKLGKFQNEYNKGFDDIAKRAKGLASAIKNSKEYQDFIAAKERLDGDAMNKKVLRELREQQLNFQFMPVDDDLDKKARFLNEMYMAVSLNPVISDYLNAEYRFGLIIDELKKDFEEIFVFDDGVRLEESVKTKYKN